MERGTHKELLKAGEKSTSKDGRVGTYYRLWMEQKEKEEPKKKVEEVKVTPKKTLSPKKHHH